jgi:hypothetical protein
MLEVEKVQHNEIHKGLLQEIEELRLNKERNYLLERLELAKQESLALKKSLADYKVGYNNLTEKCQTLTEGLAKAKADLEHAKQHRRKSRQVAPAALQDILEGTGSSTHDPPGATRVSGSGSGSGSESVSPSDSVQPSAVVLGVPGKRRSSSRMSIRKKSAFFANNNASLTNNNRSPAATTSASDCQNNPEGCESLTRIQLRRLRADSIMQVDVVLKSTEEKECQVNIDSSQYANVRLGNEEEVVVKALQRHILLLEEAALDRQTTIDNLLLEKNDQVLQVKRKQNDSLCTGGGTAVELSEYQTQSYDEFLSLKDDDKMQRKQIDDLENKIKAIQEDFQAKQISELVMASKAMQCDTSNFVSDASVQASAEAREVSTQTSRHTPISNHQTVEDPFYSYIFKELLDVCKHVVSSNQDASCRQKCDDAIESEVQDSANTFGSATISGCKNLISSLSVLRKDLFEEMKYRWVWWRYYYLQS